MKTTLNISPVVMKHLKAEAVQQGRTMSDLMEEALRRLLTRKRTAPVLSPLPSFNLGVARVDISNRESLYDVMGR
ncbi:MAG: hypothetical protein HY037_04335 [Nitrospirae bacterium]|nr:hypothetical protein [Candidatus Troglogloeales bacterium]